MQHNVDKEVIADAGAFETANLPSLQELGVTSEMLEVAEEIAACSDVVGVEQHTLELLVRAVVYLSRDEAVHIEQS